MANITVSYDEMNTAAAKLSTGRGEMIERLRDLQLQIQSLVASGFVTDSASKKFETAYNEYTTSANTVVEKLTEIQQFIQDVARAHQEMDTQIAAKIN
ncbi:MAG: WXG100 family type VII secretion target [Leucobacter sp.]